MSRVGFKALDYFVFGIGFGASLILAGWGLRQFGPGLRYRKADSGRDVLSAEEMLIRHDWTRFCISLGGLLSIAGAIVFLGTIVTLLIRPSDRAGSIVAGTLFVLVLAGVAAWIGLFLSQHQGLGLRRTTSNQAAFSSFREDSASGRSTFEGDDNEHDDERVAASAVTTPDTEQGRNQVGKDVRSIEEPVIVPTNGGDEGNAIDIEHGEDIAEHGSDDEPLPSGGDQDTRATDTIENNEAVQHGPGDGHRSTDGDGPGGSHSADGTAPPEKNNTVTPVADSNAKEIDPPATPRGETNGDDIVSSVTIRESYTGQAPTDPKDEKERTPGSGTGNIEPMSSAEAYVPGDIALANLKLRRMSRSVSRDS